MAYSIETDRKWQQKWEETKLYKFDRSNLDKKLYCLEMFSYPSGANLHVGHWYNFGLTDSWARMKRMQGYNVFHPMGFDAFGLPAENYAIKTGIHPKDSTYKNIRTMEKQLREMGATYDWDYEVITCAPEYYKWTQWIFLQLYKHGLAYRKKAPVNWCPSCKTVLANEQVIDGACERCHTEVTKKDLTQWFFKITAYAQELLDFLPKLDWPEKTKKIQTNWIGRSEGAEIEFKIAGSDKTLKVFTTRADTLYGVTYVVLAPESELTDEVTTDEYREQVEEYREFARKQSEIERMSTVKEKTGVFTGGYAINPVNDEKVPIWIADYVLAGYGTGCVMAVPAHDERDYEFAKKFNLPIKRVIRSKDGSPDELPFTEDGILVDSGEFSGMTSEQARIEIVKKLQKENMAEFKVNYRLRDWLVSRQRYWGAPIPIIYCDDCGIVPVPEEDLPVELPYNVEFTPDGESPLAKCEEFMNTTCPKCGKPARRDPDTLDTFVCSSWYFLRYPDNHNDREPFNREWINKMLPVDKYVGGAEHAAMHLLYARFITKALRDMGYLDFDEPFKSLVHQGTILGPDGSRMSKSKGNTISPDDYIREYGSDVFRLYLAFGFSYTEGGPWSDDGIKAISRFVNRVERLVEKFVAEKDGESSDSIGADEKELIFVQNTAIKGVTEDAEKFQFNTSVARIMELTNALYKYDALQVKNRKLMEEAIRNLLLLLAPFAPHFCEEMWEKMGYEYSIFNQKWPTYDPKALVRDTIEMAVQINGQVKYKIQVPQDADNKAVEEAALNDEKAAVYLKDKEIVKIIVVPKRLVNIVVKK
ncbi:leucine--tRNA ligase LeuS [Thermoclostridium stercorarium subsp. stercorarium DSM 8532]|uniref:Leucine--tRNA ligase n=2 Tax=Thermoclostridium stercorarium TaxID=1510 RepID=L7VI04_THES1|nr:leucine--tRNA ligase [Thermoclostridium stercorarium]AGC67645.1 leucine--tRNA ligase LeuS [Thermoclostridium stercorarium subsp. stercorarium DSM 8532]AGI38692.1 leucyl-tRNA synthetase [Thermoclostridium stercorarium subsp. stercorarium DSM 8532]ANW98062.1 leucine--tRNA ligase [Thermoclostridium stercorarium subsp. thermolacticum DSM 2910]